jgi:hypothetical protein
MYILMCIFFAEFQQAPWDLGDTPSTSLCAEPGEKLFISLGLVDDGTMTDWAVIYDLRSISLPCIVYLLSESWRLPIICQASLPNRILMYFFSLSSVSMLQLRESSSTARIKLCLKSSSLLKFWVQLICGSLLLSSVLSFVELMLSNKNG